MNSQITNTAYYSYFSGGAIFVSESWKSIITRWREAPKRKQRGFVFLQKTMLVARKHHDKNKQIWILEMYSM